MSFQPGAMVYTQSFGSRPENVEVPHIDVRPPTTIDNIYPIGKRWIDTVAGNEYALTSQSSVGGVLRSNWAFLGSSSGDLNRLTTQDLTPVTPTAGTILFNGNNAQGVSTTGSNAPGTVTVTVATATTGQIGVTTLASSAQTIAGSNATNATTPASVQAKLGVETAHGVAMGNTGPTSALSWSSAGTTGQAFISGGAAADGAYGTLGVPGGGTGAVTLTGVLTGNGTSAMTASAITQYDVLVGGAANAISSVGPGLAGQVLQSGGAAANPVYSTATYPAIATGTGTILRANGTNWIASTNTFPDTVVAGSLLAATATNVVGAIADVATGQVLMSGGVGVIPAFSGSPSVSGSLTAATTITATLGAITATNGNFVFGTAGNKILSTSVATTLTAGANSFGSVTLVGGTIIVSTSAVTTNSLIFLSRMTVGATGAAPLGMISAGTIVNGVSFVINSWTTANATTLVATDVSNVAWFIVN